MCQKSNKSVKLNKYGTISNISLAFLYLIYYDLNSFKEIHELYSDDFLKNYTFLSNTWRVYEIIIFKRKHYFYFRHLYNGNKIIVKLERPRLSISNHCQFSTSDEQSDFPWRTSQALSISPTNVSLSRIWYIV